MIEEKTITLYLTSWQKRMIKDQLKANAKHSGIVQPYDNLTRLGFHIDNPIDLVTYRVPDPDFFRDGGFVLYFTDEQITQVVECTGFRTKINAMTITPAMLKEKVVVFG